MRGKTSTLAVLALVAAALPLGGTFPAASQEQCPQPLPDPRVIPWQITGPPAERLNLIILGDGYQCDQQSLFRGDVARNLAVMWATEPYKSYRNYMNVYAVEISSVHYGVRCDPDGRVRHPDGTIRDTGEREGPINTKNTALRMIYQNGCSDPLARGTVYGGAPVNCQDYAAYYANPADACETGNQAHNRIIDQFVVPVIGIPRTSQSVQTLAIFNTFTYGGIGGTQATTSGGSPQGPLISLHELGHSHGTMADEYPYSSRDVVRPCYTGGEPGSFHHTIRTSTQDMIDTQFKWWRWIGEESLSGGVIGLHEGGNTYPCGVRRPSEHSIMRWLGFDWDQVGREHMVARITGLRDTAAMPLPSRPETGLVGPDEVLWVRPIQPRDHGMQITWRIGGAAGTVVQTNNAPYLDLDTLEPPPGLGTLVHVEVRDPVGPDGIDWVRNPSTGSSATDSGYNGPRFVQTRQWPVGLLPVTPSPAQAEMITGGTLTENPVNGTEWVYVETVQPTDRVLDVTWELDGVEIPNPHNLR
ncbi:MAG TPA: M64 family metallopeptidase, partial [Actinomycetota bacterium]